MEPGRRLRRTRSSRGFTLVELLVAVALSAIVIVSMYNMFITAAYVFNTQNQASATQLNLRYAMEQVKDDLRRAGLLTTANSRIDGRMCPKPPSQIFAIIHENGAGVENVPFRDTTNAFIVPDRLVLTGNYSSAASYPAKVVNRTVQVQLPAWTRRESRMPAVYGDDGFSKIFRSGQYVRITNAYGSSQIMEIADVFARGARKELILAENPTYATGGSCGITGTGDGLEVNPVNFIEYRIGRRDPDNARDIRTDLIRQFLDKDRQPITGEDYVVGEYIVDFQIWFMLKDGDQPGAGIPEDRDLFDFEGNINTYAVDDSPDARPDLIRSAVVRLCARNPREDTSFVHRQRPTSETALMSFDLDGNGSNGSARVACLTSEVEVVNLTIHNLRPFGGSG